MDSVPLVRDWATTYEWIRQSRQFAKLSMGRSCQALFTSPLSSAHLYIKMFSSTQRSMLLSKFQNMAKYMTKYGDKEWLEQILVAVGPHNMLSFDVAHCDSGVYPNVQPFPIPHSKCDWIMGGPDDFLDNATRYGKNAATNSILHGSGDEATHEINQNGDMIYMLILLWCIL